MPARDYYHDVVKRALVKDGWTVTHDPLHLKWGLKDMYVDMGAEQLLAAEKAHRKIAVEVKSFIDLSQMHALEHAFGQYAIYQEVLRNLMPDRELFMAVNEESISTCFRNQSVSSC